MDKFETPVLTQDDSYCACCPGDFWNDDENFFCGEGIAQYFAVTPADKQIVAVFSRRRVKGALRISIAVDSSDNEVLLQTKKCPGGHALYGALRELLDSHGVKTGDVLYMSLEIPA